MDGGAAAAAEAEAKEAEAATAARPASLLGCLSVSSASLPPNTLSHFSPMSLEPDHGGGDGEGEKNAKARSE